MPVQFFSNELTKAYDRFNQTFGKLIVFNKSTRQRIFFAIISLGLLERKIMAEENKDLVRDDIQKFVRTRNTLNRYFDEVERRINYVEYTKREGIKSNTKTSRNRTHTIAG